MEAMAWHERRIRVRNSLLRMCILPVILVVCLGLGCEKQKEEAVAEKETKGDLHLGEIPQVVMDGLTARFPEAEIHKWTRGQEDDIIVYDIEFTQSGQNLEADIEEDGSIDNWERAMARESLPEAVTKTVEAKYPGSSMKEIMEITTVTDGMETPEGYEITLEGTGAGQVEITVAPDGTILEDSSQSEQKED
jgi:hypothetical protein